MIELLTLWLLLIANAFICMGFHNAVLYHEVEEIDQDSGTLKTVVVSKMILWWVKYYTQKWPGWIKSPLYECTACMASLHSIYVYWPAVIYSGNLGWPSLGVWIIYVLCLSGLNGVIIRRLETAGN